MNLKHHVIALFVLAQAGFIAHVVAKVAQKNSRGMRPLAGNSKRSSLILAGISVAYFALITMQA